MVAHAYEPICSSFHIEMSETTHDVPTSEANRTQALTMPVGTSTNLSPLRKTSLDEFSDGDGGERPVREKLKKTSIAGLGQYSKAGDRGNESQAGMHQIERQQAKDDPLSEPRGRLGRKRSFDDLQNDEATGVDVPSSQEFPTPKEAHHKRMRSRDMTTTGGDIKNGRPKRDSGQQLEEENDRQARMSPGGPGVLVDAPSPVATTPPANPPSAVTEEGVLSPKKKRSRDQFDKDFTPRDHSSEDSKDITLHSDNEVADNGEEELARSDSRAAKGEPEKKRHRDGSEEVKVTSENDPPTTKIQASSGFANNSAVSAFASITSPKSPPAISETSARELTTGRATSPAAFASSGLSVFANAEKSGFGALGPTRQSRQGFAGPTSTTEFGSTAGFGEASPFTSKKASGFGGLGSSGFGNGFGSGFGAARPLGGLSSFAGPATSSSSTSGFGGGSATKAFGAPAEEEENENSDDEDGRQSETQAAEEKPRDKRFHEKEVETGEEHEETIFSCRAKLYHFEGKEWKERGVGTLKVNVLADYGTASFVERKPRLIMRTDGVHRVVLNTPVFKGMKVGAPDGGEPTGKTMNLTGMEVGKPALFILKIGKEDVVKDLYHKIMELQADF